MNTVFSLALVGLKLRIGDSVSILRMAIPQLDIGQNERIGLKNLAWYFDRFNEPLGIKEILAKEATRGMSDVVDRCLDLLQKHDPEFVAKWRSENTTDDAESS